MCSVKSRFEIQMNSARKRKRRRPMLYPSQQNDGFYLLSIGIKWPSTYDGRPLKTVDSLLENGSVKS